MIQPLNSWIFLLQLGIAIWNVQKPHMCRTNISLACSFYCFSDVMSFKTYCNIAEYFFLNASNQWCSYSAPANWLKTNDVLIFSKLQLGPSSSPIKKKKETDLLTDQNEIDLLMISQSQTDLEVFVQWSVTDLSNWSITY